MLTNLNLYHFVVYMGYEYTIASYISDKYVACCFGRCYLAFGPFVRKYGVNRPHIADFLGFREFPSSDY